MKRFHRVQPLPVNVLLRQNALLDAPTRSARTALLTASAMPKTTSSPPTTYRMRERYPNAYPATAPQVVPHRHAGGGRGSGFRHASNAWLHQDRHLFSTPAVDLVVSVPVDGGGAE